MPNLKDVTQIYPFQAVALPDRMLKEFRAKASMKQTDGPSPMRLWSKDGEWNPG